MSSALPRSTSAAIDVLVLAPLQEELEALLRQFEAIPHDPPFMLGHSLYRAEVHQDNNVPISVVIAKLPDQGTLRAAAATVYLGMRLRPRTLVSFGISGRLSDDVDLGDVVLADAVWYYEPMKETSRLPRRRKTGRRSKRRGLLRGRVSVFQSRPALFRAHPDPRIVMAASHFNARAADFRVHVGQIASGEKLVADLNSPTRRRLSMLHDKMLAVEQEAAGVAAGAEMCGEGDSVAFIAVKGVSDHASHTKSRTDRSPQQYRQLAATRAAAVLWWIVGRAKTTRVERPPPIDHGELAQRVSALEGALWHGLVRPPRSADVRRVLSKSRSFPTVFYGWCVREPALHLVDAMHLRQLRRLSSLGYPVELLLIDDRVDPDSKRRLTATMRSLVGERSTVAWLSEVRGRSAEYLRHAADRGFVPSDVQDLLRVTFSPSALGSERRELDWIPYIVWRCRDEQRSIIMCWHRIHNLYRLITDQMVGHDTLELVTEDIRLSGKLAKFEYLDNPLCLDPPANRGLLTWALRADVPAIDEVVRCLALGAPVQAGPYDSSALETWLGTLGRAVHLDVSAAAVERQDALLRLVRTLQEINREAGLGDAPAFH